MILGAGLDREVKEQLKPAVSKAVERTIDQKTAGFTNQP